MNYKDMSLQHAVSAAVNVSVNVGFIPTVPGGSDDEERRAPDELFKQSSATLEALFLRN